MSIIKCKFKFQHSTFIHTVFYIFIFSLFILYWNINANAFILKISINIKNIDTNNKDKGPFINIEENDSW